jgi:hypothetical protein
MKSSDVCFCCGLPATTCDYESDDPTEMFCAGCSMMECCAENEGASWMSKFLTKVIRTKRAKYRFKEMMDE